MNEPLPCDSVGLVQTHFRPLARNAKKWPKNGFWAHRGNGRKMAAKWEKLLRNWSQMRVFDRFSHSSAIFLPFPRWSLKESKMDLLKSSSAQITLEKQGEERFCKSNVKVHLNKFF